MKINKILSLLLSAIMAISCIAPASFAFADVKVTEDNGVVLMEEQITADRTRLVYYPKAMETSSATYPVIVWANGTGCEPSLYASLFNAFAGQGFIIVASNETMAADGTDQIASLNYILDKSKIAGTVLYNKVDANKLVAMGHSQGGRSAVNAAAMDSRFCCVVSLAGSNYEEEAQKLSTPTFFITGTKDMVVSSSRWVKTAYNACKGPAVYASLINAVHTTCCSQPEQYVKYSVKWINAWANKDAKALKAFTENGELDKDSAWQDLECKNLPTEEIKSTSISKLTAGKKQVKVTCKKLTDVKGYQIQVATNNKFTKGKKTVTVKGAKTTSTTVKKLTSNKKYYVRIRTYKIIDGKKQYSAWSKAKTVKVK